MMASQLSPFPDDIPLPTSSDDSSDPHASTSSSSTEHGEGGDSIPLNGGETDESGEKKFVCILKQPDDGRHHVELFQEQLFALPVHVRRHVLPTEEMALCTSPDALRQLLIRTDPYNELAASSEQDDSAQVVDWKELYIDRYQLNPISICT